MRSNVFIGDDEFCKFCLIEMKSTLSLLRSLFNISDSFVHAGSSFDIFTGSLLSRVRTSSFSVSQMSAFGTVFGLPGLATQRKDLNLKTRLNVEVCIDVCPTLRETFESRQC